MAGGAQTGGAACLEALVEAGVAYVVANFGSDHPAIVVAIVVAIAAARANGRPLPEIVTCPNEMVGMSAAHGYAQVSGRPQAVPVHVECGTQALAGAVHDAAKGRVPMLVFAGASPFTQAGELKGSRNEFIQWIQDVHVAARRRGDGAPADERGARRADDRARGIARADWCAWRCWSASRRSRSCCRGCSREAEPA